MKVSQEQEQPKPKEEIVKQNRGNGLKVDVQNPSPDVDSRWMEYRIEGRNLHVRSHHSSCVDQGKLYIYGGYDVDQGILEDFGVLDLQVKGKGFSWTVQSPNKLNYPEQLQNHTAVMYNHCMYIFGGQRHMDQNNNETFVYDTQKQVWRVIPPNIDIPKLDSHGAVVFEKSMFVFGGYICSNAKYSNTIYRFDLVTEKWEVYHQHQKNMPIPSERAGFGMDIDKNNIWLFGGTDGVKQLNDFWCFNIESKMWTQIKTEDVSKLPEPRRNLTLVAFNNNLFIFGGILDVTKQKNDIYVYDISGKYWSKIHSSTNSIYECSPTLKHRQIDKKLMNNDSRVSSPSRGTGYLSLIASNSAEHDKFKTTKDDKQKVMGRILEENRHKKFLEKKRLMLKEFDNPSDEKEVKDTRRFSPTSENMKKILEIIGDQSWSLQPLSHEVKYDETGRYILGKKPCARDAHSASVYGNSLLIFGGDRHLMSFCDLYSFDMEKGLLSKKLYEKK